MEWVENWSPEPLRGHSELLKYEIFSLLALLYSSPAVLLTDKIFYFKEIF